MLEKLKNLSTAAKVGIASGAALLTVAGVGVGITQPWKQNDPPPEDPPAADQQQTVQQPAQQEEKQLSVRAGNDVVPCVLYEGDGWSIYVPEGWTAEKEGENGALFSSGDGAQMEVEFLPGSDYMGSFVNLSASGKDRALEFYQGIGEGSPVVTGTGPESQWGQYGKLFTALARTLTVGGETPFGEVYIIPQLPDWQKAEGKTVLFLDKDGFIVDDKVQNAVEDYMQSWSVETRGDYTGQYRVNDIQWAGSYTGITEEGYIDVFRADVQYRLREGAAPQGVSAVNGWARGAEDVFLAVFHDGGSVTKNQGIVSDGNVVWADFAALLK